MKVKYIPAARTLLDWSQADLADKAGVSRVTINNVERGEGATSDTLNAIETTLHRHGVVIEHDGVREVDLLTETLEGEIRYFRLFDDIFHSGDECLINGADESKTPPALVKKVQDLRTKGLKMRHLVCAGDTHLRGPLTEYRYVPQENFTNQVRFVYAGTLAIFTKDKILLIRNADIAEAERRQFNLLWSILSQPETSTCEARYV